MNRITSGAALAAGLLILASPLSLPLAVHLGFFSAVQAQSDVATDVAAPEVIVAPTSDILAPENTVVVNQSDGSDTVITIPVDDIVTKILGWAREIIIIGAVALIGWAGKMLPATLVNWLLQEIVRKNMVPAIDWGLNTVKGAVRGASLDINVGSAVVAEALQYFVDHAPGWLVRWLGGSDKIRDMIIARIPLDSAATAEAVVRALGKQDRYGIFDEDNEP